MVKLKDVLVTCRHATISDLEIGQTGYITPWIVFPDDNDDMWITNSSYCTEKTGTRDTRVTRTKDSVLVDLIPVRENYGRKRRPQEEDIKIAGWI